MLKLTQILFIFFAVSYTISAEAGMRCPNGKLVNNNDKTTAVLTKCGKPYKRERFGRVTIEHKKVNLERWTYVPEKGKFIKYLEFHNGILKEISNGPRVK